MGPKGLSDRKAPPGEMSESQAGQTKRLLKEDAAVRKELRRHGIGDPVADYAEILACQRLGLTRQPRSSKGVDAVDKSGTRFQIKARKAVDSSSPQLGIIRDLESNAFDYLIAVIFEEGFEVRGAWKIPHSTVLRSAGFSRHQNGHRLTLTKELLQDESIEEVTERLKVG